MDCSGRSCQVDKAGATRVLALIDGSNGRINGSSSKAVGVVRATWRSVGCADNFLNPGNFQDPGDFQRPGNSSDSGNQR